ncbi:MAG TPA: Chromate resistance protein ChrB [Jiangellaceae bacterium]
MAKEVGSREWVFLTYSLPRTPSAPRLALWRKLKRLGVAQLADGLVALPADARTREQLEWAAADAVAAGGVAGVWLARPTTRAQEREITEAMNAARAQDYRALIRATEAALEAEGDHARALRRLRAENHRIQRRDFFRPPERDVAREALTRLAARAAHAPDSTADDSQQGAAR